MPTFPTNTMIRASESTENIPSSRRVRDVSKRIAYLDPDAAPFTLISSKLKKKAASNSKFEWIEKTLENRWDMINGTTGTGTSIVVDHSSYFSVGDIVNVVRTGEKLRVTAINTGTETLTVTRSVGGTATAAVADNDDLQIIGNSFAEGATSGDPKSHQETYPYNYTQIFRTPFGVTGSEMASENYTGPDRPRLQAEKGIMHKIDLERAAIFGEKGLDNSDTNNPLRYTGGLLEFLASGQNKDFAGILTEAEVEDWLEDLFYYTASGNQRTLFCSPLWISVLDQLAQGRVQMVPSDRTYGITVKQWVTGHGTLMIVKHKLLEYGPNGTGYGAHAIAVDLSKVMYRPLRGRDTKLLLDIQENDRDGVKDEYLSEVGFQIENPEVHGYGYGVTG